MKIVKNNCFGGFGLSPKAFKRYAELKGKTAYFFGINFTNNIKYRPLTTEEAEGEIMFSVYSVPNPQDYNLSERDEDGMYRGANKRAEQIRIEVENRADPDLVKVVEELNEQGIRASGIFADLEVVEIPDGVEWEIDEYDGLEIVREKHRSW